MRSVAGGKRQLQDKIAFIILFHAATMHMEKAQLPARTHSSMSYTKS